MFVMFNVHLVKFFDRVCFDVHINGLVLRSHSSECCLSTK